MTEVTEPGTDPARGQVPPPLTVAVSVVAVQGLGVLLFAVLQLARVSSERAAVGVSNAVFFGAYGALLVAAAWALWRRTAWARGPVMLTQLICLGLAWGVHDVAYLAILMAVSALVALAGLLHPDSMAALGER